MAATVGLKRTLADLDTPALVVDLDIMEQNIALMSAYFRDRPAKLRPHIKTHKTPEIARRQIEAGAIGVTCAKVGEAEVMAAAGIQDILIANQVVGTQKIARLAQLARLSKITVAVDDLENVLQLSAAVAHDRFSLNVLVEIDIGLGRGGLPPGDGICRLAQSISQLPGLNFAGLMGYEGHTVLIPDLADRRIQTEAALLRLIETKELLEQAGLPVQVVSAGGTGTYNITGAYPGITEVQAGSYVFMDAVYKQIVPEFDCAVTILSTVTSRPRERLAILDLGLKTLSNDNGVPEIAGHGSAHLFEPSEEHWNVALMEGTDLKAGDQVQVIPGHICTTVNLYDRLYGVRDGQVEVEWPIAARGRAQ